MKVKMNKATMFEKSRLNPGDIVEVDETTASRWDRHKLAVPVENEKPIEKMTTAELTALAAELGVDISGAKTNPERVKLILAAEGGESNGTGAGE